MEPNGARQQWLEIWNAVVHRTNPVPMSSVPIHWNASISGTNTSARKLINAILFLKVHTFVFKPLTISYNVLPTIDTHILLQAKQILNQMLYLLANKVLGQGVNEHFTQHIATCV